MVANSTDLKDGEQPASPGAGRRLLIEPGVIVDDRYELIELIGEGGMGSLYKAIELELQRTVAIKFLQTCFLGDSESELRFKREGKALSSFQQKNIVGFYRFGAWHGVRYIAMEYLEGVTLRSLLDAEHNLTSDRCIAIALQACQAIAAAHQSGVVHRDLKPGNMMLLHDETDGHETLKIVDFGLSSIVDFSTDQHLTRTGEVIGSVLYMSPEQCMGRKCDGRSDIYSLGCIMYEMLCGNAPYVAENPIGLMHKHVNEAYPLLVVRMPRNSPALPAGLESVIRKCLEKDAEDRYQNATDLFDDLVLVQTAKGSELVKQSRNVRSRAAAVKPRLLVSAILALVVTFAFCFAFLPPRVEFTAGLGRSQYYGKNSALARKLASSAEIIAMQPEARKQYCQEWLRRYNSVDDGETARAHYYMLRDDLRTNGGILTEEISEHFAKAREIATTYLSRPRKYDPDSVIHSIELLSMLVDLYKIEGKFDEALCLQEKTLNDYLAHHIANGAVIGVMNSVWLSCEQTNDTIKEEKWLRKYISLCHDSDLDGARARFKLCAILRKQHKYHEADVLRGDAYSALMRRSAETDMGVNVQNLFDHAVKSGIPELLAAKEYVKLHSLLLVAAQLSIADLLQTTRALLLVKDAQVNTLEGRAKLAAARLINLLNTVKPDDKWVVIAALIQGNSDYHVDLESLLRKTFASKDAKNVALKTAQLVEICDKCNDRATKQILLECFFDYFNKQDSKGALAICPLAIACADHLATIDPKKSETEQLAIRRLLNQCGPLMNEWKLISALSLCNSQLTDNRVEAARKTLSELMKEQPEAQLQPYSLTRVLRAKAAIAGSSGDISKCRQYLLEALAVARKRPGENLGMLREALESYARFCRDHGEPEVAQTTESEARSLYWPQLLRIRWNQVGFEPED